jgi:hypothetical protein
LRALLARVESPLDFARPIASQDETDLLAAIVAVGKKPDLPAAEFTARNTNRVPAGKLRNPGANSNHHKRHRHRSQNDGRRYHDPSGKFAPGVRHRR